MDIEGMFDEFIDKAGLVCTFCGKKPVVGYTFSVDAEIDDEGTLTRELIQDSIIATCEEHLPILQEKFEKEVGDAEFLGEVGGEDE